MIQSAEPGQSSITNTNSSIGNAPSPSTLPSTQVASHPMVVGVLALVVAGLSFMVGSQSGTGMMAWFNADSQTAQVAADPAVLLSTGKTVSVKHGSGQAAQCDITGGSTGTTAGNTNCCLKAGTSCPGFTTSPVPANVVDENSNTLWCSKKSFSNTKLGNEQVNDDWLYIDLGSSKQVGSVYIEFANYNPASCAPATEYTIQTSDTMNAPESTWVTKATQANDTNTDPAKANINITKTSARYVRIKATKVADSTGWRLGVREFKVWGWNAAGADLTVTGIDRDSSGKIRIAIKNVGNVAVTKPSNLEKGICYTTQGKAISANTKTAVDTYDYNCLSASAYPVNPGATVYGALLDGNAKLFDKVSVGVNGSLYDLKAFRHISEYAFIKENDYTNNTLSVTLTEIRGTTAGLKATDPGKATTVELDQLGQVALNTRLTSKGGKSFTFSEFVSGYTNQNKAGSAAGDNVWGMRVLQESDCDADGVKEAVKVQSTHNGELLEPPFFVRHGMTITALAVGSIVGGPVGPLAAIIAEMQPKEQQYAFAYEFYGQQCPIIVKKGLVYQIINGIAAPFKFIIKFIGGGQSEMAIPASVTNFIIKENSNYLNPLPVFQSDIDAGRVPANSPNEPVPHFGP